MILFKIRWSVHLTVTLSNLHHFENFLQAKLEINFTNYKRTYLLIMSTASR